MVGREVSALVKTVFFLVALYLVLVYAGGARRVIAAGSQGFIGLVKALQGR